MRPASRAHNARTLGLRRAVGVRDGPALDAVTDGGGADPGSAPLRRCGTALPRAIAPWGACAEAFEGGVRTRRCPFPSMEGPRETLEGWVGVGGGGW